MSILDWAARWNLPRQALKELAQLSQFVPVDPKPDDSSESAVQTRVRLEAARAHIRAWRNNVGASKLSNGSFVRWGLCNDTQHLNSVCKSADLIGIKPHLVEAADVGKTLGIFWSRECKRANWKYSDTPEERAQVVWAAMVKSCGGDAEIVTGPGSV